MRFELTHSMRTGLQPAATLQRQPPARSRWCARGESNPYARRHLVLSQARLPSSATRARWWPPWELNPQCLFGQSAFETDVSASSTRGPGCPGWDEPTPGVLAQAHPVATGRPTNHMTSDVKEEKWEPETSKPPRAGGPEGASGSFGGLSTRNSAAASGARKQIRAGPGAGQAAAQ